MPKEAAAGLRWLMKYVVAIILAGFGLWLLAPWRDKAEWRQHPVSAAAGGVFLLAAILVAFGEIG